MAFEGRARVGCNEEAKLDSEKDVFHEGRCEGDGVESVELGDNGEAGEVAHGAEDVF